MFRKDRLTIKRKTYEIQKGEAFYLEDTIVAEDIPCHLSVSLNNAVSIKGVPTIVSSFTLFLDPFDIDIQENDILHVTSNGQTYKLYAGEIKFYDMSIQIKCMQNKIIESKK